MYFIANCTVHGRFTDIRTELKKKELEVPMQTKIYTFTGPQGTEVPIVAPVGIEFPSMFLADYSSYCGAGKGFGDILVPETMWGLTITIACYVHDHMWEMCLPTWEAFHFSNSVFLRNILSCIRNQSKSSMLKRLRNYRAVTYYNAVDSFGKEIFWDLKSKQNLFYEVP